MKRIVFNSRGYDKQNYVTKQTKHIYKLLNKVGNVMNYN